MSALRELYQSCSDCQKCALHETRRNIVFGTGNPNADILFVCDYPTEAEDREGDHNTHDIKWVISAFRDVVLQDRKIPMDEAAHIFFSDVFLVNALMCRPTIAKGEKAGEARDPKISELNACRERLMKTIYEVDPHIIISAGKFASIALLSTNKELPSRTGKVHHAFTVNVPGELRDVQYTAIGCHDPSFAQKIGDYDDPNGAVSQFCSALRSAWGVLNNIRQEDT